MSPRVQCIIKIEHLVHQQSGIIELHHGYSLPHHPTISVTSRSIPLSSKTLGSVEPTPLTPTLPCPLLFHQQRIEVEVCLYQRPLAKSHFLFRADVVTVCEEPGKTRRNNLVAPQTCNIKWSFWFRFHAHWIFVLVTPWEVLSQELLVEYMNRSPLSNLLDPSGSPSPRLPLPDVLCRGHSHYGLCCSQHLGYGQLCLHPGQCDLGFISLIWPQGSCQQGSVSARQKAGSRGTEADSGTIFFRQLHTVAATEPPFMRHHGNIAAWKLECRFFFPSCLLHLSPAYLSFPSLAVQLASLGRFPPPLLRSSYPY